MKAGAQFEQRGNPSARDHASAGGLQDAAHHLQESALAAAVGSDQTQHFALLDFEADVLECPEIGVARLGARKHLLQPVDGTPVEPVKLRYVLYEDQIQ